MDINLFNKPLIVKRMEQVLQSPCWAFTYRVERGWGKVRRFSEVKVKRMKIMNSSISFHNSKIHFVFLHLSKIFPGSFPINCLNIYVFITQGISFKFLLLCIRFSSIWFLCWVDDNEDIVLSLYCFISPRFLFLIMKSYK